MFALLARDVWNTDLDSFSHWINPNECPRSEKPPIAKQVGLHQSCEKLPASPSSTAHTFFFSCHSENVFFRTGNQFPSQLRF